MEVGPLIRSESKTEILFVEKSAKLYKNPLIFDGADFSYVKIENGRFIPIIDKFCYVGTWLTRDEDNILDVKQEPLLALYGKVFLAAVGYHHMQRNLCTQYVCCQFFCTGYIYDVWLKSL